MPSPLTLFGLFMLPVFKLQMKIHTVEMSVRTSGKGTYEITDKVTEIIKASGISSGQVSVFVCHTSCSLVVMENADPSARTDLHAFFDRLVPEDTPYFIHTCQQQTSHQL